jgi:phage tail protein X
MIAYKAYGKESAIVQLIEANSDLANIAIFPSGVQVICPTIAPEASRILPPWRR